MGYVIAGSVIYVFVGLMVTQFKYMKGNRIVNILTWPYQMLRQ